MDSVSETSFSPVMSSILGHCCSSSQPRYIAGPTYITLDGCNLDLSAFSISCDTAPLLVQSQGLGHEELLGDEEEPLECGGYEEKQLNLDSLYNIIVSTGFVLE